MSQIATFVFVVGILGLFLLDRDSTARTSKLLWIPVIWLLIAGSRPVSAWLGMAPLKSPEQYLEGSPFDRVIFIVLIAVALLGLWARRKSVLELLKENGIIVAFLLYCAISISWSDYPDVAFKRWIKALGDFVMVLVVLTDPNRLGAIKRLFARVGFLLLPLSILLIKYYPDLGRLYSPWEGTAFYIGVATDKNMLGKTCLIFGLAAAWRLIQTASGSRRKRTLVAHGIIVLMTLWLLKICNSLTSLACFILASALILALSFFKITRKQFVVNTLVAAMIVVCFAVLFLGVGGGVVESMGRDSTLTGRTELWKELIGMNANPMLGTGFESFWLGERLQKLWELHWWHPNEAHNGYLEVYLNLGFIGVAMLAAMIVKGYRNVRNQLNRDPETGRLLIAYFVVGLTYNFTEAAIRTTDPMWITFLLAIVAVPMACLPEETETRSAQSSLLSHAVVTHMPLSPRRFHRTDPS